MRVRGLCVRVPRAQISRGKVGGRRGKTEKTCLELSSEVAALGGYALSLKGMRGNDKRSGKKGESVIDRRVRTNQNEKIQKEAGVAKLRIRQVHS